MKKQKRFLYLINHKNNEEDYTSTVMWAKNKEEAINKHYEEAIKEHKIIMEEEITEDEAMDYYRIKGIYRIETAIHKDDVNK